ncbi:hypothetical protein [Cohnella panacarvi]|uniref:hypothetical protein n=1 Tax=Cohnella panacarvi TaxID=400776 RepID=UPI0004BA4957|nr:hypothetical protein [Cohnella panacarvi]
MKPLEEELKKAYETLGLPTDATREQVEKRYFILMKKVRTQHQRAGDDEDGDDRKIDLGEYSRAYKLILGIESEKASTQPKQSKLGHFFYYYKVHLIVSIVILLIAGYSVKEAVDKRNEERRLGPIDLSIGMMGNFYFADMDLLKGNLMKLVPEWNRIEPKLSYIPLEIRTEQDIAYQQKSVLNLIADHDEMYFVDRRNFDNLVMQGAFRKLEELQGFSALNVPEERLRLSQSDEDPSPAAYGIEISGNPIFNGIELTGEDVIVGIRTEDERLPKTFELLTQILKLQP